MTERYTVDSITSDQLDALYDRLDAAESDLAELTQARQHAAYTFCAQTVGHVTVAEFARKIAEKRTALAQREEAVRYANEQRRRAERAEAALERVRAIHTHGPRTNTCNDCGQPWPCELTRAITKPAPIPDTADA